MKKLYFDRPGFDTALKALTLRPGYPPEAERSAAEIISGVRERGDAALAEFAAKFDRVALAPEQFRVSEAEIDAACAKVSAGDKAAIDTALEQVRAFALATMPRDNSFSPRDGVTVGERFLPMERVGVYVPGGTAPLVSTVIHTAGIAKAVGVKQVAAATPCNPSGEVHAPVLYAMRRAGVDEIYRLGGVYGVAALAIGTESVAKVEKLVGPGNAYVTAAKKLLYGEVAIDMVAGPSEILIVADDRANPEFIAADLLSQAEHGSGLEQAVLVSDSCELIDRVEAEFQRQKLALPKLETVNRVEERGVFLIYSGDLDRAAAIASAYAPEHLEIHTAEPQKTAAKITAAGAIFLGEWTPESAGDFCAGPSHVLPTASSAHYFSGIESATFLRRTSMVRYSREALCREAGIIESFGRMENLAAHANAATVRVKK